MLRRACRGGRLAITRWCAWRVAAATFSRFFAVRTTVAIAGRFSRLSFAAIAGGRWFIFCARRDAGTITVVGLVEAGAFEDDSRWKEDAANGSTTVGASG